MTLTIVIKNGATPATVQKDFVRLAPIISATVMHLCRVMEKEDVVSIADHLKDEVGNQLGAITVEY